MSTVYEVAILGSNNGKEHVNVFHVFDGNDDVILPILASTFNLRWVQAMLSLLSTSFSFTQIIVKSLTGTNPGNYTLPVTGIGTNPDDPMVTGIHLFIKLISADAGFKAGGKLVGGFVESQFTSGEPSNALMDALQVVIDDLISNLFADTSSVLAIYRPTLSTPGFPQISEVAGALVRGDSTNNRRRKAFERS